MNKIFQLAVFVGIVTLVSCKEKGPLIDFGGEKIGFYDGVIAYTHLSSSHKLKVFVCPSVCAENMLTPPPDCTG